MKSIIKTFDWRFINRADRALIELVLLLPRQVLFIITPNWEIFGNAYYLLVVVLHVWSAC